jgi:hypothetical protein
MMTETYLEYYRRRQEQEASLEAAATSPEASSAHGELALFYTEEVRRIVTRDAFLKLASTRLAR